MPHHAKLLPKAINYKVWNFNYFSLGDSWFIRDMGNPGQVLPLPEKEREATQHKGYFQIKNCTSL